MKQSDDRGQGNQNPETLTYLIKSSDQALRLLGDSSLDTPLHHSLDVLLLVLLRHGDAGPARLQLPLCDLQDNRCWMEPSE